MNWHDFAFFDPVMYESLRQLIRHSQAGEAEAVFAAMDLAFAIDLCKEEGAGQVMDLVVLSVKLEQYQMSLVLLRWKNSAGKCVCDAR